MNRSVKIYFFNTIYRCRIHDFLIIDPLTNWTTFKLTKIFEFWKGGNGWNEWLTMA